MYPRVFDQDGDGLITAEELCLTMNNLGEPVTKAEVQAMISEADLDGDGKINFSEFKLLMKNKKTGIHWDLYILFRGNLKKRVFLKTLSKQVGGWSSIWYKNVF